MTSLAVAAWSFVDILFMFHQLTTVLTFRQKLTCCQLIKQDATTCPVTGGEKMSLNRLVFL